MGKGRVYLPSRCVEVLGNTNIHRLTTAVLGYAVGKAQNPARLHRAKHPLPDGGYLRSDKAKPADNTLCIAKDFSTV